MGLNRVERAGLPGEQERLLKKLLKLDGWKTVSLKDKPWMAAFADDYVQKKLPQIRELLGTLSRHNVIDGFMISEDEKPAIIAIDPAGAKNLGIKERSTGTPAPGATALDASSVWTPPTRSPS